MSEYVIAIFSCSILVVDRAESIIFHFIEQWKEQRRKRERDIFIDERETKKTKRGN